MILPRFKAGRTTKIQVELKAGRMSGGKSVTDDFDPVGLASERDRLIAAARTVSMAVSGESDIPEMGVTPMIRHEGDFYIYPSHLSRHVRAVLSSGKAAFLVIEDEESAQNIWARKRIKFDSEVIEIERQSDQFNLICDAFESAHGPTMSLIRDFSDFHLLRLRPLGGVMVLGFAQAYRLEGETLDVTAHLRSS